MAKEVARGFIEKTVEANGTEHRYVVYVPRSYDPKTPIPAIVFLHGSGECGTDGLLPLRCGPAGWIMLNRDEWPFIMIFPQKPEMETLWEEWDAMVTAEIEQTVKEYRIDESRLYLTGLSQGGHGTWAIAALHPDRFAAIAPICGWVDDETAKQVAHLPIRAFHGVDDDVVPVESTEKAVKLLEPSGKCTLTIYPGVGHNSWDKAYHEEKLGDWFLRHRKSGK